MQGIDPDIRYMLQVYQDELEGLGIDFDDSEIQNAIHGYFWNLERAIMALLRYASTKHISQPKQYFIWLLRTGSETPVLGVNNSSVEALEVEFSFEDCVNNYKRLVN